MNLTRTRSFTLATISEGEPNSKRVAICLPGRLDTKDYWNFPSHMETLAAKGFYALSFDPPGSWDSPGGMEIYTTTNYIKATNELIEHLGDRPTLLLGHSRGGQVSMLVGVINPAVVGFVSVNGSFGSPSGPSAKARESGIQMSYRDLPPGDKKTLEQKQFALPLSYFKDGESYNPVPELQECSKPKLFFYSENDAFHSPKEVLELVDNLPEPKMAHKLKGTHDYRYYPEMVEEVNKTLEVFLNKYLPE